MRQVGAVVFGLVAVVAGWFGLSGRSAEDAKTVTTKGPVVVAIDGESQGVVKYLVPVTDKNVKPGALYFQVVGGVISTVKGGEGECPPECYTLENDCHPDPCRYQVVITEAHALKNSCPPECVFSVPNDCPPACATGMPDQCPPQCMYEIMEVGK